MYNRTDPEKVKYELKQKIIKRKQAILAKDKARDVKKLKPDFYWRNRETLNGYEMTSWKLMNDKWDCAKIWNHLCDKLGCKPESYDDEGKDRPEVKEFIKAVTDRSLPSACCWRERPHYNVMFSNGYDSTSLIIRHLEKGEYVIPFYVSFFEGTEVWADLTIKQLQKKYPHLLHDLVPLFNTVHSAGHEDTGFAQQSFVTFYASKINSTFQEDAAATEVAFCMNDDALSYLEDLKGLYQKGLDCTYPIKKGCPLKFPQTKIKHVDNFELVDDWQSKNDTVLFCNELDSCDLEYHWNLDKHGNLWGMILNKGYGDKKENKLCYRDINAYIVRFKPMKDEEPDDFTPLRN